MPHTTIPPVLHFRSVIVGYIVTSPSSLSLCVPTVNRLLYVSFTGCGRTSYGTDIRGAGWHFFCVCVCVFQAGSWQSECVQHAKYSRFSHSKSPFSEFAERDCSLSDEAAVCLDEQRPFLDPDCSVAAVFKGCSCNRQRSWTAAYVLCKTLVWLYYSVSFQIC